MSGITSQARTIEERTLSLWKVYFFHRALNRGLNCMSQAVIDFGEFYGYNLFEKRFYEFKKGEFMNITIGKKIKALRKERNMTQERLADLVGVSFQAVSKWENGIALPDITLVPRLAQIFGVTTDELFDYNQKEIREEIERYVTDARKHIEADHEAGRKIIAGALKKYPENDVLLNNLLYFLNYSADPDKTIRIANKLIDKTTDHSIRYDALRFLAYAYHAKGDTQSAVAALEQIPELYFTKASETAFILTGKPMYEAAEKQKWLSFEILLQMMSKIAEYHESVNENGNAVAELERAISLISALQEEDKINELYLNYFDYFKRRIENLKE